MFQVRATINTTAVTEDTYIGRSVLQQSIPFSVGCMESTYNSRTSWH